MTGSQNTTGNIALMIHHCAYLYIDNSAIMKNWLVLIGIGILILGCNKERDQLIGEGPTSQTLEIDGLKREYIVYLPMGIQKDAPLVFVCHGYTGSAKGIMDYSKMNQVADSNGFAVCYPQGSTGKNGDTFWQVGYAFNEQDSVDDVKFISELAVTIQKKYKLSKRNTFITGMSNGGDMCNLLSSGSTDVFKATAPVVGCMMKWFIETYPHPDPIPMMLINGTKDDITLWAGDMKDEYGWGPYHPTEEMFDFWIQANHCTDIEKKLLPNLNSGDGSHVILEKHTGGEGSKPVWIYKVIGGKHDWPGSSGNMDIDASEIVWAFFKELIAI